LLALLTLMAAGIVGDGHGCASLDLAARRVLSSYYWDLPEPLRGMGSADRTPRSLLRCRSTRNDALDMIVVMETPSKQAFVLVLFRYPDQEARPALVDKLGPQQRQPVLTRLPPGRYDNGDIRALEGDPRSFHSALPGLLITTRSPSGIERVGYFIGDHGWVRVRQPLAQGER
jgi:hypothetical protein